jgi:hypothetical protein
MSQPRVAVVSEDSRKTLISFWLIILAIKDQNVIRRITFGADRTKFYQNIILATLEMKHANGRNDMEIYLKKYIFYSS